MEAKTMKLRETMFFRQFVTVVAGAMLVVMSFAFVAIPMALGATPGPVAAARAPHHLT